MCRHMRAQATTAVILTCLLLMASVVSTGQELNDEVERAHIGPNTTTTAWGVSYDWSELPSDIKDLTGIDIEQILLDLEEAALDGHINLDLDYGINGSTYYYVVQSQGESTEIDLAGEGGDEDVDAIDTTITLRMAVESTAGMDFDWTEDDVGFDFDIDSMGNNAIIIDIHMTEYYTDDFHLAGMDLSLSGGMSYSSSMSMDADIHAGNDHITFDNTTVSMSMDYTITELTAEWRMEEESTIYEDILSGDYDVIHWDCDSYWDESQRHTWSESIGYEILDSGVYDEEGERIVTDHHYDNNEYENWTIKDPSAESIRLHWGYFDTEYDYDKVMVRDGYTGQNLDEFTGYRADEISRWYDTNYIELHWESDSSYTAWGFELDFWESGISAGKEEHLQIMDACGEVDYDWDVGFGYDLSLSNFPASDLGLTSDQVSFSLSDSLTESGRENGEDVSFYHTIEIVDHNYEVVDSDGTTREVVRVSSGGPMMEAIGGMLGMGMALAIEDSDFDDLDEDLEEIAEEWGDDYDEDDDETMDIAEDFEDTDIEDDMEEFAEEVEEVMEDVEDGMESEYSDLRMYWLIDKETGNQLGPQVVALDSDHEWVQMMGPETDVPPPAEEDAVEWEYHEGEEAEEMQEDVANLDEEELLEEDPLAPDSDAEGDSEMMTYLLTGGIVAIVILVLGVLGMMLMLRNRETDMWGSEQSVNQAFNQTAYDMMAAEMGVGVTPTSGPPSSTATSMPPSGPPLTTRGEFKDGIEWTEFPPHSGTWYYRDTATNQWVKHG